MYTFLYQYLLLHKRLPLPGVGQLVMEVRSATANFPEKKIEAPAYAVSLTTADTTADRSFFSWLGDALGIHERDAVIRFNDFAFEFKKQIRNGAVINWDGIGKFSKDLAGNVRLETIPEKQPADAVQAEKIVREKAVHTVRVGEDEKTSGEMELLLSKQDPIRNYWWVWALIAGLLLVSFIGWYLSENGVSMSSVKNTKAIETKQQDQATYRLIP